VRSAPDWGADSRSISSIATFARSSARGNSIVKPVVSRQGDDTRQYNRPPAGWAAPVARQWGGGCCILRTMLAASHHPWQSAPLGREKIHGLHRPRLPSE